jgi:hypothetical protein
MVNNQKLQESAPVEKSSISDTNMVATGDTTVVSIQPPPCTASGLKSIMRNDNNTTIGGSTMKRNRSDHTDRRRNMSRSSASSDGDDDSSMGSDGRSSFHSGNTGTSNVLRKIVEGSTQNAVTGSTMLFTSTNHVFQFLKDETIGVIYSKRLVYLVIFVAAVVLGTITYVTLKNDETEAFYGHVSFTFRIIGTLEYMATK